LGGATNQIWGAIVQNDGSYFIKPLPQKDLFAGSGRCHFVENDKMANA